MYAYENESNSLARVCVNAYEESGQFAGTDYCTTGDFSMTSHPYCACAYRYGYAHSSLSGLLAYGYSIQYW